MYIDRLGWGERTEGKMTIEGDTMGLGKDLFSSLLPSQIKPVSLNLRRGLRLRQLNPKKDYTHTHFSQIHTYIHRKYLAKRKSLSHCVLVLTLDSLS
jgi:hypothetical protein